MTTANSCEKSSIAPCTIPAASGSPRASNSSSFVFVSSSLSSSPSGSSPALRKAVCGVLDHVPKRALAGAIADEALVVLELDVVAVDVDGGQPPRTVSGDGRQDSKLVLTYSIPIACANNRNPPQSCIGL